MPRPETSRDLRTALAAWQPTLVDAMDTALRELYGSGHGSFVTIVAVDAFRDEPYIEGSEEPAAWLELTFLTFRMWERMTGLAEEPDLTWDPATWHPAVRDGAFEEVLDEAVCQLDPTLGTPAELRDALADAAVDALSTPRIRDVLDELARADSIEAPALLAVRDGSDPVYTAGTYDRLNAGKEGQWPHLVAEGRAYWRGRAQESR